MTKSKVPLSIMNQTSKNYLNFLKLDTRRFRGQWIILAGKKIVAHGKKADVAYRQALKKHPREKISLAKIPAQNTLVLWCGSNTKKK